MKKKQELNEARPASALAKTGARQEGEEEIAINKTKKRALLNSPKSSQWAGPRHYWRMQKDLT
jgi:hypothetical protein